MLLVLVDVPTAKAIGRPRARVGVTSGIFGCSTENSLISSLLGQSLLKDVSLKSASWVIDRDDQVLVVAKSFSRVREAT